MAYSAQSDSHIAFMKLALRESEKAIGFTEPNPMVGAVVVKQGRIIGRGHHRRFGAEHAERMALADVSTPGTTLYVTLEPCAHQGKTPPCTDIVRERRVRRVFAAITDPNPLVNGRGLQRLREAGITVEVGLLGEWATRLNRHYIRYITSRRPHVTIHAGISLDGKMSDRRGESRWVTCPISREVSHGLRGEFSAILAGRGTITGDDPLLTIRHSRWADKTLYRVILDRHNSLPATLRIFRPEEQARFPLVLFSSEQAVDRQARTPLHFFIPENDGRLDLQEALRKLGELGIASVLVEGGGAVIDSFLQQGLFDEVCFFMAHKLIGGTTAVAPFATGVDRIEQSLELERVRLLPLPDGFILRGEKRCSPA